jgi:hypothetical protein
LVVSIGVALLAGSASSSTPGSLWYRISITGHWKVTTPYSTLEARWRASPPDAVLVKRLAPDDIVFTTTLSGSMTSYTASGNSVLSIGDGMCLYKWTEHVDGKPKLRGSAATATAKTRGVTVAFKEIPDAVVRSSKQVQCGSSCAGSTCKHPKPPTTTKASVSRSPLIVQRPSAYIQRVRSDFRFGVPTYLMHGTVTSTTYGKTFTEATITLTKCADQSAVKACKGKS